MARKSIAPWSERVAEGLIDQPIDSSIQASQTLTAIVDTGFIDQTGTWKGVVSSDSEFSSIQTDIGIANGVAIITPSKNADNTWPLDMTGYCDVALALKVSNTGNYAISAIMGPSDLSFGGLTPIDAASNIRIIDVGSGNDTSFYNALVDAAEGMDNANVWKIFMIKDRLTEQKLLQFKIVNNTGGSTDIQTAFLRIV